MKEVRLDRSGGGAAGEDGVRVYTQRRYWVGTLGPLLLLAALLVLSLLRAASGASNRVDRYVLVVIPLVLIINVLGLRQPKTITDTPELLIFEGMRRRQVFRWREMTTLKVKEFAFTDRIYIRVGPSSAFAGAYWVDLNKYPGFAELKKKLLVKEGELHPDRIPYQRTVRARPPRRAR